MDFCAFEQDNSAVKGSAKFSGLDNETTAQSLFKLIAWRIGRDYGRKINFKMDFCA